MIVLITGCGSGFGLLSAVEAARRGHTVYAGLRDLDTAEPLRRAAGDLPVHPVQLDVTSAAQREAVVARILAEQGRLDGLVNNAGIAIGGFLEQLDEDELRRMHEVNYFAAVALTRTALPALRAARGIVISVTSMAGRAASPSLGGYAASKFALEGAMEAWRHELRPFGVRVTLVEPGPYKTDIFSRNRVVGRNVHDPQSPYAPLVAAVEGTLEANADGRMGDPMEVARLIVDLLAAPAPALRYPLGPLSTLRLTLRALLPWRAYEAVVARAIGLSRIRAVSDRES